MSVVLDASALLAFLQNEPGSDALAKALGQSMISAVNWCEVIQKSLAKGVDIAGLADDMAVLGVRILPYTAQHAETAGRLWLQSRSLGLSLGDRSCLALGLERRLPVLTTDRAWLALDIGLDIRAIR